MYFWWADGEASDRFPEWAKIVSEPGEYENGHTNLDRHNSALLRASALDLAENGYQHLNEPLLLGRAAEER